jgi:hypothetical protein
MQTGERVGVRMKATLFQGGTVYAIPSGNDKFDLEISPPFREEYI